MKKVKHQYESKPHFESRLNPSIRIIDEYGIASANVPEWVKNLKPIQQGEENFLGIPLEISYLDPKRQEIFVGAGMRIPLEKQQ